VASIAPPRQKVSEFELRRRAQGGNAHAKRELALFEHRTDITSILHILTALLLVVTILVSVALFGWLIGVIVAVVIALEYAVVARIPFIVSLGARLYKKTEPYLLGFATKAPGVLRTFRVRAAQVEPFVLSSAEELRHVIDQAGAVLTADQKRLLTHGLTFGDRLVSEVMTPRTVIDSIEAGELLGPIMLDDLHKRGHSRLPVTRGDIDHVVGILYVQDLLTVHQKKSLTAAQAMEPRVFYIREDQTLQHALTAFIRTHHHLFVVVNEYRETVGVLALEDVIEALLGHAIVDEFDAHDDLRAVAARNPQGNNQPKSHTDV
jgi:CBS domain containing-hemolysin-like protein